MTLARWWRKGLIHFKSHDLQSVGYNDVGFSLSLSLFLCALCYAIDPNMLACERGVRSKKGLLGNSDANFPLGKRSRINACFFGGQDNITVHTHSRLLIIISPSIFECFISHRSDTELQFYFFTCFYKYLGEAEDFGFWN